MVLSETWREEGCEMWSTTHDHSWFGSGGSKGQCGVGFLLHSRWKHILFKPCSNRAAALDLCLAKTLEIRFVAAYFPHGGHLDEEVDALYASIEAECAEARAKCCEIRICLCWDL